MTGADGGKTASPFRTLLMPASKTEMVMKHPTIQGVSLTGSTRAGESSENDW
jgi:acyl-CoA reductase-like NAD-dependent aldehyde dehydrogenase